MVFSIMFFAMFYSVYLLSIAQILIVLLGIFHYYIPTFRVNTEQSLNIFLVMLFFAIPLVGMCYSSDWNYGLERLRIKLPYLLLPLAFFYLPKLNAEHIMQVFKIFLLISFLSAIQVILVYYFHPDATEQAIQLGGHLYTPCNHIRYSLLINIAILFSLYLFDSSKTSSRILYLFFAVLMIAFVHFLSVRTGILSLYLLLTLLALIHIIRRKKYIFLLFFPLVYTLFHVSIKRIPTLKTKYKYTVWEVESLIEGDSINSTLENRVKSIQLGWGIFGDHPLLGVGTGDLKSEVHRMWNQRYSNTSHVYMPHNQFVSWLASHGLILSGGLIILSIWPIFLSFRPPFKIWASFTLIILVSFLFENTIENSLGVAIHSFFSLFLIKNTRLLIWN